MAQPRPAVHRTILVVDVEGFSSRINPHQLAVRDGLYRALRKAFAKSGLQWTDCHHEDRGDGALILAPSDVAKAPFVESLPQELATALREHNTTHRAEEHIRLRMALHAGEIHHDDHGVAGASINLAFRLLEASQLKSALATSPGVLALITSAWFYDDVVQHSSVRDAYQQVRITVKETTTDAWITLPDQSEQPSLPIVPERSTKVVPRQLPARTPHFVGRIDELKQLDTLGTVVISAIGGTAGIGKTALALHWAYQAADRFPDGQLYVNLRGFDPTGTPMHPAEAVRGFLDAFQVPPERIPVNLDAQAALYRSLLTDRKVLVVLDNARDAEQVRPLLPGSSTCLALVTSRQQLGSLIAREGAKHITLDFLTTAEARELLAKFLGTERILAESDAVDELIERCVRLPIALTIAAARALTNPHIPLNVLVTELAELSTGDSQDTDIRAVFSWSYTALSPGAAGMFRLLGLHPGPDIDLHATASLAGVPTPHARALLTELTQAHLLDEHTLGRYRFHDLLRAYAAERATGEESEPQQRAALHRVLDHYLHTGFAADRHLHPHRDPITVEAPQPGVTPRQITSYEQAVDWFTAEHPILLATSDHAARTGWDTHAWQLPWTLADFLYRQGHWHDFAATQQTALAAANRLNDRDAQVRTHRILGHAYVRLGRYAEARTHLQQALTLYRDLGDRTGQAHTHRALGWACELQGRYVEALTHDQHALDLYRATGHHAGQADALNALGWCHARLGHYQQALTHCQQALHLFRELGDRDGEAATLDSLGYAHHHLGHHDHALTHYQQALTLYRELGDHYYEADTLTHLGDTHHATGNHPDARDTWQQALAILDQLDHPDAETVRAKLTNLDTNP